MKKCLYVFPDTNVFVQCKALEQLDWSIYCEWESIDLILTRPVQAEIDSQKGKGTGRLAKRARAMSSIIRTLLKSDKNSIEIKNAKPRVCLSLRQDLKRDEQLSEELDYSERDDQLVGITSKFIKDNARECVFLLTHDTGPMASAKLVGVPYSIVPDNWLLPPENDAIDKRINAAEAELAKYKNLEPKFEIECVGTSGILLDSKDSKVFLSTIEYYSALSAEELNLLMEKIIRKFPIAHDFGSSEQSFKNNQIEFKPGLVFNLGAEKFIPASVEEISKYRADYDEWIKSCRKKLENLHLYKNFESEKPKFSLAISNNGSRPAENVLIIIEIKGNLKLMPMTDEVKDYSYLAKLKVPPVPPRGEWKKARDLYGIGNSISGSALSLPTPLAAFDSSKFPSFEIKDDEKMYWKSGFPKTPQNHLELECKQWRHGVDRKSLDFQLFPKFASNEVSASINISVHAANMTIAENQRQLIKINLKEISLFDLAQEIVNEI